MNDSDKLSSFEFLHSYIPPFLDKVGLGKEPDDDEEEEVGQDGVLLELHWPQLLVLGLDEHLHVRVSPVLTAPESPHENDL